MGKLGFVDKKVKCCDQMLVDPSLFLWEAFLASWLIDFSLLATISAGPLLFLLRHPPFGVKLQHAKGGPKTLVSESKQAGRREKSD